MRGEVRSTLLMRFEYFDQIDRQLLTDIVGSDRVHRKTPQTVLEAQLALLQTLKVGGQVTRERNVPRSNRDGIRHCIILDLQWHVPPGNASSRVSMQVSPYCAEAFPPSTLILMVTACRNSRTPVAPECSQCRIAARYVCGDPWVTQCCC